jgi:energy-coupling factor transporter ATP-binding protein EcfA2
MIEITGLYKQFGRFDAIRGLSLSVPEGSAFVMIEANGAGKTTTIKTLMNLIEPDRGSIRVMGLESTRLTERDYARIGLEDRRDRPHAFTGCSPGGSHGPQTDRRGQARPQSPSGIQPGPLCSFGSGARKAASSAWPRADASAARALAASVTPAAAPATKSRLFPVRNGRIGHEIPCAAVDARERTVASRLEHVCAQLLRITEYLTVHSVVT